MDKEKRKHLREQAKLVKTYLGVYKIENKKNGKIYLASSSNLKNQWMRQQMQLDQGKHMNAALQKDYNEFGEGAFELVVLEELEVEAEMDVKWELEKLEKVWFEKLQPYDEKGYNNRKQEG